MKNILLALITIALIASCRTEKSNISKPIVSVSIAPQEYFIKQLIGDSIEVNVMIPQGSDHASYAPTAAQIKKLSKSVAYIQMGHLGFEATWNERLKGANTQMKWYDLSKGISMIQGEHHHHHDHDHVCTGGIDPHTWTSPKEVKQITRNLKIYLTELFPQYKGMIAANYEQFMTQLDDMDERLNTLQTKQPGLTFMIFHPAYTYLARAYDFEQITIEFEGKTPTPAKLKSTINLARQKQIKTIYIQQEFDQTNANVIANEIGATTVQVNPLSANWQKEMERFISHLEKQ
ncbi:zinc ABC transporter substrate-binding protein [Carboxylicivirga sp. A043]|uniref:metal ABC transporter solute-binding protein, Zn/Mn family n=1 Tax=Carboxylicivirga litoralis TaxID=2816963 RepID=UPI0021CAEC6D|nr:zinc ABC transporter substrate-binding protein [Carboxylicivirga sp. A043]MCU4154771.1 zinc ABC transporter substrate-binding protein [Carboxylicivirga sp. A043]